MTTDIDEKRAASAQHNEHDRATEASRQQHVEGNALLVDKQGQIRRLPIPSNSPNDPLNWKAWEKSAVIFCCCWFCELAFHLCFFLQDFVADGQTGREFADWIGAIKPLWDWL